MTIIKANTKVTITDKANELLDTGKVDIKLHESMLSALQAHSPQEISRLALTINANVNDVKKQSNLLERKGMLSVIG